MYYRIAGVTSKEHILNSQTDLSIVVSTVHHYFLYTIQSDGLFLKVPRSTDSHRAWVGPCLEVE